MEDSRKWLIPIAGCVVLLICAVCAGGIALAVAYQEQLIQVFATTPDIFAPTSDGNDFAPTPRGGTPTYALGDMQALIQEYEGQPCDENPDFTCVTLTMPLDHFDASNPKTVDVVFAIHPAAGERRGMFFQAYPGGPGGEGVSTGSIDNTDEAVLESFDLVYFDQRGVGLSSPLTCPTALAAYNGDPSQDDTEGEEGPDTPGEQDEWTEEARAFVQDCIEEIGVPAEELQFYSTQQVVEDIEDFRQAVGAEKFYLYGVSYGTVIAQQYAAVYGDHLAGMILDGTVDLTLTGAEFSHAQETAFEKALLATFDTCKKDAECINDFGGDDPLRVYDDLASGLAETAQTYAYPLPDGTTAEHLMTFSKLEATATYQMYFSGSRMLFLRALAAAHRGDLIPMARLYYAQFKYDPETEVYLGDPSFSDVGYYFVHCTDNSYFTGTVEERIAQVFEDGQASIGIDPRLDGGIYTGLVCAYWPSAPDDEVRAEPLVAEGISTFVLNATLDPATPFEAGKAVFEHLDDGYHLYVDGGHHASYGYEETCPDDYVNDFLLKDRLPARREIECTWESPVTWSYIPPMPADAGQISDLLETFYQVDLEIILMPEHFYNSEKSTNISAACPYGGSFSFILENKVETFNFTQCEFSEGLILTGSGTIDMVPLNSSYTFDIDGLKEGSLIYTFNRETGSISLTGTYDGKKVDLP